jgi:hypothetical protein
MSELHFKRLAARAMRQVLVEAARRRNAHRRGGEAMIVTFDDGAERTDAGVDEILALDQALTDLARIQPRQAMMVETRVFRGTRCRRDSPAAARVGSDGPARLASSESKARSRASGFLTSLIPQRRYADAERELFAGYAILHKQTSPPPAWVERPGSAGRGIRLTRQEGCSGEVPRGARCREKA